MQLRADLDGFFARKYGLTRDQLRNVLDPADMHGPVYPSETFRGVYVVRPRGRQWQAVSRAVQRTKNRPENVTRRGRRS